MKRSKKVQNGPVTIEPLEGRRLLTAIIGTEFDPIVGPVGTTPGTIGGAGTVEPVGGPSGYPSQYGLGIFTIGYGNGNFSATLGTGSTTSADTSWDSNLFFQKGFPLLLAGGAVMRINGGTLNISGTNGNDTILLSQQRDTQGDLALVVSVNGDARQFDATHSRFVRQIFVSAGSGNDVVEGTTDLNIPMVIHGGKGNDSLAGGAKNDKIFGEQGNDVLVGGRGNDLLNGGAGNDTLSGDTGADHLIGGNGNDQGDGDDSDLISGVES